MLFPRIKKNLACIVHSSDLSFFLSSFVLKNVSIFCINHKNVQLVKYITDLTSFHKTSKLNTPLHD